MSDRFSFPRSELRARTVRGALITAAVLVGIDGLVLVQGLIVTRLLGPEEIGLYGIVSITVVTILALKRVGIDEAFVQQDEDDQQAQFQYAFTLELLLAVAVTAVLAALAPVVAAVYGQPRLLGLMLALSYLPIAAALQAPLWIFFRRMDYARQRGLQAIQPLVTFAVTLPLAAGGVGVWSIVIGQIAGYAVAVAVALAVSPFPLALRWDRAVAGRYLSFSAWVLVALLSALVVAQGQVIAFESWGGLAAAGFVTLALTLTRYIDRADQIVTATIYPAICAIQGRTHALEELFVKSNRATLLYVLPASAGLVLFAPDLVAFVVGQRWHGAVGLVQGLAGAAALQQLGFNWFSFYRAHGDTRPPAVEGMVAAAAFVMLAIPGLALWGVAGFVWGRMLGVAIALAVRWVYVRRLLPGVRVVDIVAGALIPLAPAVAAVVALRLALWGGDRTAAQAFAEVVLFLALFGAGALRRERALLSELRSARLGAGQQGAGEHDGHERQGGHLPVPVDRAVERPDAEAGDQPGAQGRIGALSRRAGAGDAPEQERQ
jgi:O-antigen/teichoic acid export membrane protein